MPEHELIPHLFYFYFTLLGELYTDIDDENAKRNFAKAVSLAKTANDKLTIQKKIDTINNKNRQV